MEFYLRLNKLKMDRTEFSQHRKQYNKATVL